MLLGETKQVSNQWLKLSGTPSSKCHREALCE
jgi:hypothetical protein